MIFRNDVDLYLVGLGIWGLHQLTREAEDILRHTRKVFHLTACHKELVELCESGEVINNAEHYWVGDRARNVYKTLISKIIGEVEKGPGVANVIYGHPLFYDDINTGLIRWAKENNRSYHVVPGISCLDTLSADLELDFSPGLQVHEAQHMVYNQHPLNPKLKVVVMQVGSFGAHITNRELPSDEARFMPLQEHLLKFYPPNHEVTVVFSDRGDSWKQVLSTFAVASLAENNEKMFRGTTMYIPPIEG